VSPASARQFAAHNSLDCYLITEIIEERFYCREAGWLVTSGYKFFHSSLKDISRQEHPSLTFEAFKADVGTHPHHFPFIAAAGVCLAQPDYITELYFCSH
jgi:hypothetical protein